jgi:hypothetical protein
MTTKTNVSFISALTAGIISCYCFSSCAAKTDAMEPCQTKTERETRSFQHRIDSLYEQTQVLQSTLTATEILLNKTRKKNKQLRASAFIPVAKPAIAGNNIILPGETVMTWPVATNENDSLY